MKRFAAAVAGGLLLLGCGDDDIGDGDRGEIETEVVDVEGSLFACFTQDSNGEDEFDCEPLG